ncbi:MAG: DUF4037 domain-containing protein [Defluviitaleaceae bacterium]|nr:DUF4037 domain-containing protein [Defluviitaleaceae bacterium]
MSDQFFDSTIERFREFEEVDAIVLGGSRGFGLEYDPDSDYDVYVYLNRDLDVEKRKAVLGQTCKRTDLGRAFFGDYWDDCVLNNDIPMELIYRNIVDARQTLQNHLENFIAWGGYTTCTCHVILNSKILHDPKGLYADMVKQFTIPYPEQLRTNIVTVNMGLLTGLIASFSKQIEKAIKRNDAVSVNHRTAEFVKSYFDIIFALNKVLHPGEKNLIKLAVKLCPKLPVDFETDLGNLLASNGSEGTVPAAKKLISNLDDLLFKEELWKTG